MRAKSKFKNFSEEKERYLSARTRIARFGIALSIGFSSIFNCAFGAVFGGLPLFFMLIPILTGNSNVEGDFKWLPVLFILPFICIGAGVLISGVVKFVRLILLIKNAPPVTAVPAEATSAYEPPTPSLKETFGKVSSTVRDFGRGNLVIPGDEEADRPKVTGKQRLVSAVFGAIFLAVGCGIITYGVLNYVKCYQAAETWVSVPCEIVSAKIDTNHSRKGGTSYSLEITFRYTYQGETFSSDEIFLQPRSSFKSHSNAKQELHRLRKFKNCWVDPEEPSEAALEKPEAAFSFEKIIFPVFGLPFALMGGFVFVAGIFGGKERKDGRVPERDVILPEADSPFGTVFFALGWNSFVALFLVILLAKDEIEWILVFFLIPFSLIGLIVFVVAIRALMKHFSGFSYTLSLRPSKNLVAGEAVRVLWKLTRGEAEKLARLSLSFVEMERDDDTEVNGKPVFKIVERTTICESGARIDLRDGACDFTPPEDKGSSNRKRRFAFELELERKTGLLGKIVLRFPVKLKGKRPPEEESVPET